MPDITTDTNVSTISSTTEVVDSINPAEVVLLAERVYQLLLKELVIENERTGRRN